MSGSDGTFEDLYKPSRRPSVRRAKYAGQNTFTIHANIPDIEAFIDELNEEVQAAARPAAQAAAEVLYQAVRANVAALGQHTGNLYNSIYQKFSPENSGPGRATYHISWRTSGAGAVAPHGHLIEWGHIQRYATYVGSDGNWYTAVRPENHGKQAPWIGAGKNGRNKRATQAQKDAWYVLRKGGPVQIAARPFIRTASALYPQAIEAATAKLLEAIK